MPVDVLGREVSNTKQIHEVLLALHQHRRNNMIVFPSSHSTNVLFVYEIFVNHLPFSFAGQKWPDFVEIPRTPKGELDGAVLLQDIVIYFGKIPKIE